MHPWSELLQRTAKHAQAYLDEIHERQVAAPATSADLRALLGGPLPADGDDARDVIDRLAEAARRGTTASQGPRYFGFVTGGSMPPATAADWLVGAWDQNAGIYALSPFVSIVEDIAAGWVRGLAGVDDAWTVGFVTGCQMANFTALAAARHRLLARAGWDVEARGLFGAPPIDVLVSDESHYTIFNALKLLGLGADRVRRIAADDQGRMRADALAAALRESAGPVLITAQAGNVNTGSVDPLPAIADLAAAHRAWLHVDGAFGFWAVASASRASLVEGIARADSIATDAHKWLNVPYDCGIVLCRDRDAHRRAMTMSAAYILASDAERDGRDFVPEESRRGRAVPVYAVLRALGRRGLGDLVDRGCALAQRMAEQLARDPRLQVLNDVVLNQVLVRAAGEDADARTRAIITRVQQDGTCWLGGTTWKGMAAMRISISNWSTTEADIDRSADAVRRVVDA